MDSSLLPFFKPKGVVIIGASTSPEKLGYGVARNLIQSGYQGVIHFISRRQGELFGRSAGGGTKGIAKVVWVVIQ
jgi:acetyltransferase